MSNSTVPRVVESVGQGGRDITLPVDGGSVIVRGTLVAQLATGCLVPGSTASSGPAVGVSMQDADNTSGADGALRCKVHTDKIFLFPNGLTTDACSEATPMGAPVYMHDDHTVYDNDASGTLKRAGYFAGMEPGSGGKVRVFVTCFGAAGAVAAAPAALTFNLVVGTANSALQALPDPTDTPATADALRDDLVATLYPALRNNFADVGTQIEAIRAALVNAGLMA